jgi:hypothetical protein
MLIKTKLTQEDYAQASLAILFTRTAIKIMLGIGVFVLIFGNLGFLILPGMHWSLSNIITPIFIIFFVPLTTWFAAKKNYSSNQRLAENIEYQFGNEYLFVKGESFTTQSAWDKVYKVTETKKWIFVWQSQQIANIIPKRDIWEGDIIGLKEILDNHGVKNTLRAY